jgi:hypothetical protein
MYLGYISHFCFSISENKLLLLRWRQKEQGEKEVGPPLLCRAPLARETQRREKGGVHLLSSHLQYVLEHSIVQTIIYIFTLLGS